MNADSKIYTMQHTLPEPSPNLNHTVHFVNKLGREYAGQIQSQKQNEEQITTDDIIQW